MEIRCPRSSVQVRSKGNPLKNLRPITRESKRGRELPAIGLGTSTTFKIRSCLMFKQANVPNIPLKKRNIPASIITEGSPKVYGRILSLSDDRCTQSSA